MADTIAEVKRMAKRSLDVQEIQNVMSKHAYYHCVGYHLQELEDIWIKEGGEFDAMASFGQNHGYWVGMKHIKQTYGDQNEKNRKANLEKVSKLYPEIENIKENEGIGSLIMHTLTTPIIEVAGDGKTAKAVWYSPGQVTEVGQDGKPMAMWMWEKYGVDFAKEDGKWKIWHIHMYTDFAIPPGKSWVDPDTKSSFSFGDTVERPPEMKPDVEIITYQEWSPTTVPQLLPRLPEPYETFSETFSYGPE